MEYRFVQSNNLQLLSKILDKLKSKYKGHSQLEKNFYRSIPSNSERPFAIVIQKGEIKVIYQLIKELKFTRGMQPVYHTQQLLDQLKQEDLNLFQKWLVSNLEGYKVLGLHTTSNSVFKPHQIYMQCKNRATL